MIRKRLVWLRQNWLSLKTLAAIVYFLFIRSQHHEEEWSYFDSGWAGQRIWLQRCRRYVCIFSVKFRGLGLTEPWFLFWWDADISSHLVLGTTICGGLFLTPLCDFANNRKKQTWSGWWILQMAIDFETWWLKHFYGGLIVSKIEDLFEKRVLDDLFCQCFPSPWIQSGN